MRLVKTGFSQTQKQFVLNELQSKNWVLQNNVVISPTQGLFLDDAHFEWSPTQMYDILKNRGCRIAQQRHFNNWLQFSEEHFQVCDAIERLLQNENNLTKAP